MLDLFCDFMVLYTVCFWFPNKWMRLSLVSSISILIREYMVSSCFVFSQLIIPLVSGLLNNYELGMWKMMLNLNHKTGHLWAFLSKLVIGLKHVVKVFSCLIAFYVLDYLLFPAHPLFLVSFVT